MGRRNFQIFLAPSALASPLRRQNSDTRKNNSAIYTGYISPCASGQPKALRFLDHWELAPRPASTEGNGNSEGRGGGGGGGGGGGRERSKRTQFSRGWDFFLSLSFAINN